MVARTRFLLGLAFGVVVALASFALLLGQPARRVPPTGVVTRPKLLFNPGGQVHGYVIVAPPKQERFPYIRLPQAHVFLKSPSGAVVTASGTTTNAHGFFIVPKQPAGRYQICADASGYLPNCDSAPITLVNGTFVLNHDLTLVPKGGFIHGQVQLKDGGVAFRESQFFRTFEETSVSLTDSTGHVIAGPVPANSLGLYVLPNVPMTGAVTVRANYATSSATRGVTIDPTLVNGNVPVNLVFSNSAPKLEFTQATLAGREVHRVNAGEVVRAEVRVKAGEAGLQFQWRDEYGTVLSKEAAFDWTTPTTRGPHVLDVQVSDGKGGFAHGHLAVRTGPDTGAFFNGVVTDRATHAPVAGAVVRITGAEPVVTRPDGFFATTAKTGVRYVINVHAAQYALASQVYYSGTTGLNVQLDRAQRHVCADPAAPCRAISEQKRAMAAVQIEPGTIVDENGAPVSGAVTVDIHAYDLTQPNALPGDYTVIRTGGRSGTMESFGAVDVQLGDGGSRRFQLAPGKTAHIRVGVDPDELAKAPPTIPLLSYDEASGNWKEEGTLTLAGNAYEADVPHFSAWNADSVFSGTACVAVHVQDQPPNFAPPFPFRLHGDIPTSPGLFRHPDFTVTSAPFALYRLPPNTNVTIELHTNSGPDFPTPPTFTVNSGPNINPVWEAAPFNGIPPLYAINTECHGSVNIAIPLPTHDVPFLNVPGPGCSDVTSAACNSEATAYYTAVGALDGGGNPTLPRSTFNGWKTANGLSTDPTAPGAGEVEAIYYNNADLKFGRDMHCKQSGTSVACYVSNYSSTSLPGGPDQDAIHLAEANPRTPIATVAMEYNPALGANAVRFYVYHADLANNDGTLFRNPALDSEGGKFTPWLCMACHGGAYNATTHNVENAVFLPFDVPSFKQDVDPTSIFSEPNQRESFGALNALILATHPNSTNPNDPVTNLINGWYGWCGGPGAAGCTVDDAAHAYVPPPPTPGWPGQAALYQTIPRVYCRTCHVAQGSTSTPYPDWTQFSDFNSPSFLHSVVCTTRSMPHAEVPFKAFWLSTNPHGPSFLASALSISGGCPP